MFAGYHPAFDGPSWRRAEGLLPPLRYEDGEQPHRGDQILAPGHHHVPGGDDGDGDDADADYYVDDSDDDSDDDDDDDYDDGDDDNDSGFVQVHEQYAGQEEEWRHELRVGSTKFNWQTF